MTQQQTISNLRGELSPTVLRLCIYDKDWFQRTFKENVDSVVDLEGFDQFGYNLEGFDRAGYRLSDYSKNEYFDVNDDLLDAGEELFLRTAHAYTFLIVDDTYLVVPYKAVSAQFDYDPRAAMPSQLVHFYQCYEDSTVFWD